MGEIMALFMSICIWWIDVDVVSRMRVIRELNANCTPPRNGADEVLCLDGWKIWFELGALQWCGSFKIDLEQAQAAIFFRGRLADEVGGRFSAFTTRADLLEHWIWNGGNNLQISKAPIDNIEVSCRIRGNIPGTRGTKLGGSEILILLSVDWSYSSWLLMQHRSPELLKCGNFLVMLNILWSIDFSCLWSWSGP